MHIVNQRDGSAIKSTPYFCRGLEDGGFHNVRILTVTCNSSTRRSFAFSWPSKALQTKVQTHTYPCTGIDRSRHRDTHTPLFKCMFLSCSSVLPFLPLPKKFLSFPFFSLLESLSHCSLSRASAPFSNCLIYFAILKGYSKLHS